MSTPGKCGPRPTFTRDDVLDAIRASGLTTFTLSGIARELGVTTAALYRVVPSKDAAIELCLAEIFSKGLELPESGDPLVQLRALSEYFWEIFNQYDGLSATTLRFPFAPRVYLPFFKHLQGEVAELGIDEQTYGLLVRHLPVILASHHMVYEQQLKDAAVAAQSQKSILEAWAKPEETPVHSKLTQQNMQQNLRHINGHGGLNVEEARSLGQYVLLDFDTAWEAVQLLFNAVKDRHPVGN